MKKDNTTVSSPEELNKYLHHSSFAVWLILGVIVSILLAVFVWSIVYKIKVKISGLADVTSGEITLHIKDKSLNKIEIGQKVYISNQEFEILSFEDNNQPVVSKTTLEDGEYSFYIVIREVKPIEFLISR